MMGFWVLGENLTANPVAVTLVLDGVLALGQGVPQLDGPVPAGGHDLPVVSGEGHGQHVLAVVLNLRVVLPVLRSHRRRFLSQDPDRAKCPSEDRTTSET